MGKPIGEKKTLAGPLYHIYATLKAFKSDSAWSLPVGASTGSPWAWSHHTSPRSPEESPSNLRTSGEWNTSSSRRQVRTPDTWVNSLQEESFPAESALTTETQERSSLPGLLIEANMITGGTSSNQRQL